MEKGILEEFEGSRFRVKMTGERTPGHLSTGRFFLVEERQKDGTWKRVPRVKSIDIKIDAEKFTEIMITYMDGLPREETTS